MAEHLASIYCTERDRVNCPFFFKVGACRHGDRCSRLHNCPTISPTLLLTNMYQHPEQDQRNQQQFEDFYEDIYEELSKFGEIESLNVCDNLSDHMVGNVYVQFKEEEQAAAALKALQGRFYFGRPIIVEFSPVTNFREATCRQFEESNCNHNNCNFVHVKQIGRHLRRKLLRRYYRSRSPYYRRQQRSSNARDNEEERQDHKRLHSSSGHVKRPLRDGSEERRARIAQWNKERDVLF
ncbi:hypothetical protein ACHQM5_003148 [Ranunculus cassubicifolius]